MKNVRLGQTVSGMKRKGLAAMMVLLISAATAMSAFAAEEASAVSVKVLRTDGKVMVTNQTGLKVSLFENMKLYSGYEVVTEQASYAWMSLDDAKLAELDALSDMKVQKKGKELALMLDKGKMIFDVSRKLSADENMNVRTSNMVMGIHGTFAEVESLNANHDKVVMLDGAATAEVTHPLTGEKQRIDITPGMVVDIQVQNPAQGGRIEIRTSAVTEADVDGFVLKYLANNPATAERVKNAGVELSAAIASADVRLAADQAETAQRTAAIQAAYNTLPGVAAGNQIAALFDKEGSAEQTDPAWTNINGVNVVKIAEVYHTVGGYGNWGDDSGSVIESGNTDNNNTDNNADNTNNSGDNNNSGNNNNSGGVPPTPACTHNYSSPTANNDGTHTKTCSLCKDVVTENCNYGQAASLDGRSHRKICAECSYVLSELHTITYVPNPAPAGNAGMNGHTEVCAECGYSSGSINCQDNDKDGKCDLCGS